MYYILYSLFGTKIIVDATNLRLSVLPKYHLFLKSLTEFIHRNNLDDISSRWTRIARFATKQFIDDDEHLLGSWKPIGIPRTDFS